MKDQNQMRYTLIQRTHEKISLQHRLTGNGSTLVQIADGTTYAVKVEQIPTVYMLSQNYPNPFNPTTNIRFDLPVPSVVTLKIYNLLGQEVETLIDHKQMEEGTQEVGFDAQQLTSGVYFYRISAEGINGNTDAAGKFSSVKKMILLK